MLRRHQHLRVEPSPWRAATGRMRSRRRTGEAGPGVTRRKPGTCGRWVMSKGDMRLARYVGFIDLGVATVVLVALVLPAREMYASAVGAGSDAEQFALALSEARTMARPDDGAAIDDLSRRLGA